MESLPHAVDQKYLVPLINKQAPRFAAADAKFTFGPTYRSQLIEEQVKAAIKGPAKMTIEQLVQAMEEPATEDIRGVKLVPVLRRALGKLPAPKLKAAIDRLSAGGAAGAHRRDLDKNKKADDGDAIQIMDA